MDSPSPKPDLARALTRKLREPEAGAAALRLLVLGVGSELRADDAAGVLIARRVEKLRLPGVRSLDGGTAPENLTAEVRRISPTHLLIVDSADMGEAPGTIRIIDPADIGGISFGTHALPLSVLAGYLSRETGCAVIIMGIQPSSVDFGAPLSAEARAAVEEAAAAIAAAAAAAAAA